MLCYPMLCYALQVECHPHLAQNELRAFCAEKGAR